AMSPWAPESPGLHPVNEAREADVALAQVLAPESPGLHPVNEARARPASEALVEQRSPRPVDLVLHGDVEPEVAIEVSERDAAGAAPGVGGEGWAEGPIAVAEQDAHRARVAAVEVRGGQIGDPVRVEVSHGDGARDGSGREGR